MKIAVIAHDGKKAEMVAFLNRLSEIRRYRNRSYRNYRETCTGCRFGS